MALVNQPNNSGALPSIWFATQGTDEQLKEGLDLLVANAAASIMVIHVVIISTLPRRWDYVWMLALCRFSAVFSPAFF